MSTTGTLDVLVRGDRTRYEWNGNPKDRAAAKKAFEEAMSSGYFLAFAQTSGASATQVKATQVRSFNDLEKIERETGTVSAQISTALVGG